jgi:hypothetical protein
MRVRHALLAGLLLAMIGVAALKVIPVASQALKPAAKAGATGAAANTWKLARTPWGDPDMEGIWGVGYVFTPLERPKELAGKEFLTDQEVAALEKEHREKTSGDGTAGRKRGKRGSVEDVEGAYNQVFSAFGQHEQIIRTKRTSLVVDPPDGRVPLRTPEGEKRAAALRRINTSEFGPAGRADDPEERRQDRCSGTTLPFIKGVGAGFRRIVQSPRSVMMYLEDGHVGGAFRMVPIGDGKHHLASNVHQWLGDSAGRWEGDTLVVDVTNFTDKTSYEGSAENLHLTERYTRLAPDLLMMRVTVEDPTTFTRPWTLEVPLTKADGKQNHIFESACHEGNYALTSILAGARAMEREAANKRTTK